MSVQNVATQTRIKTVFSFVFHQGRAILVVELEWQGKQVHTALSALMGFLFANEKSLHPQDVEFCYILAKLIKKVQLGPDFYLAIPEDWDMAHFFQKSLALGVELIWKNGDTLEPLRTEFPLPLTFKVSTHLNGVLVCTMQDHSAWLENPLGWMTFRTQHHTLCFSNGTLIENLPKDLDDFVSLFLDGPKVQYPEQDAIKFIHQVYGPHKKRVYWQVQADFASILPQETTPVPILTLTLSEGVLAPSLEYQYGPTIIEPTFGGSFVKDKTNGKYYKRMPELEHIYQQDLITLFAEYELALMLQSPGDIAVFLDQVIPILLDRGWIINRPQTEEMTIAKDAISLNFMVNSSGLDWFQFEPTIQIAGQRLALQELARLMVDNKGYFKTSSGYVKIDESSQAELQALKKMGAFKVGKKFNRAEMMPLLTLANVASKDEKAQAWFTQLKTMHTSGHCEPGPGFQGTLRDYQQNGLNWMNFLYQTGLGGILADDMGLGKTIQSIAFCSQLKTDLPILVVGPTNVIYNWESEIKKFLPQAKVVIYTGSNRAQQEHKLSSATFVITTFGIVKNDSEILSALEFEAIFVDEAQYIKNPQAQISQSMKTLNARFKLAMTGTPVENHLQDLWNLFDFAMPNYLGTKREFDISVKDGQLDVLKAKIKPFVLRREKREVLQSLPEKTEILLKCPMSSAQQQLYETVLSAVKSGIRNSVGKIEKLNILTSLLKLRQVCTHPGLLPELNDPDMESAKFNLATETIAKLVEEGHKVVLFSQFTQMLDILQKWSTSEKIYTERIDGSVTGKNRADAVTRFQTTEKSGLFLISLKAGGVGINLTTADYVIHMDPWWNPAIESQATDRVHRMGQQNKVIVYKLITEGTIEEKIQLLQESKKALLAQIVDIDTMAEKAIDFKEIEALLLS